MTYFNKYLEYVLLLIPILIILLLTYIECRSELFIFLAINSIYVIACFLYRKNQTVSNVLTLFLIPLFCYVLILICQIITQTEYSFLIILFSIAYLYIITNKTISVVKYYLNGKVAFLGQLILVVNYIINILSINSLFNSVLSTVFIGLSALLLVIFLLNKNNLVCRISQYWFMIMIMINFLLIIIFWFMSLVYSRYITVIVVFGINLNILAWKILKTNYKFK